MGINQTKKLAVFSHGKESGPWGLKIKRLAEVAHAFEFNVISIDYTGIMNAQERIKKLENYELPEHDQIILVGSSMGGYVSAVCAESLNADGFF